MVAAVHEVAIIGAGPAGLAAAWELGRNGCRAVVFEKSRGVSGRAATRRRGAVRFDHGANFFRTGDAEVHRLIHRILPTDDLIEIPGDVWTFDREGTISPGDPGLNAEPKFGYRDGISTLGKLLAAASGAELRREQRVAGLEKVGDRWKLRDGGGLSLGTFDAVIVTPPAPQAADLIAASTMEEDLRAELTGALRVARYHRQFTFVLGYDRRLSFPRRFHALVNLDREHPVAWLSFEDDKAGHVPDDQSVVVVQMAPAWSAARLEADRSVLLGQVMEWAGPLVPALGEGPDWWDSQRWMHAHPASAVDAAALRCGAKAKLHFAGDGLTGRGRIPEALRSGMAVAREALAPGN